MHTCVYTLYGSSYIPLSFIDLPSVLLTVVKGIFIRRSSQVLPLSPIGLQVSPI